MGIKKGVITIVFHLGLGLGSLGRNFTGVIQQFPTVGFEKRIA